jgi:hypothetical protein
MSPLLLNQKEESMRYHLRLAAAFVLVLAFTPFALAQQDQRCFPETGQCIAGRIREFWEQNGGLPVFGFPKGPQQEIIIEGKPYQAQEFERNRLELHPENQRPYDVLLGRLGVARLEQQGRNWFTFPKSEAQPSCRFFAETGHNICGDILAAWRANGLDLGQPGISEAESLALFGLPISDVQTEEIEGKPYQAQWFERARFELHPENQPPYNVLLGLLGNEVRDNAAEAPSATTPVPAAPQPTTPPATPQPPAPSFNNCQADPNAAQAPNYPVKIVSIDKGAEVVTLQNVSQEPVNLDGWRMCSIKGNQQHPIGGNLAPGEQRTFPGPAANIWSNSDSDPGALYDPQGRLISYYND